ncbi:MAG: hypothetical protein PHN77_13025 [Thermoguttaceae bacterium]|jgi:beta-fructofuranosidase|nr:hypothetical protein [Thermoguttaceae bacterium]
MPTRQTMRIMIPVVLLSLSGLRPATAGGPLDDAVAVWRMDAAEDSAKTSGALAVEGAVELGRELSGAERAASLRRGGDGRVAEFRGGYLRVGTSTGRPLAVAGREMTLSVRLRDSSGDWAVPLVARDDPAGEYANLLYGRDGSLHYLWQTEPIERRAFGQFGSAAGTYGFNGESNDQHHLSPYQPGEFAVSTLSLNAEGLVTLFHNGQKKTGTIDLAKQNIGDAVFRVGAKHDDCEFLEGAIAEILVYDRVLADAERAAIESGLRLKWGLGPGGPGPDAPPPSQGLVLHLDAADVHADRGRAGQPGPLPVWRDKSPLGRRVVQNDRGRQPELAAAGLGGKPVVRFRGQQFLEGAAVLPAGCRELTFLAVWKRDHASGSEVICEQSSPGAGRRACLLTTSGSGRGKDFLDGVLRLRVPLALVGSDLWHDVLVRFRGPNLELFVDGVLVDEEWPHGRLVGFRAPLLIGAGYEQGHMRAGFRGQIDHVAVWDRALGDEEIAALAGGPEEVGRRERQINGPVRTSAQYWKPRGYNAWAGDCMPMFHDGTFRLFYLFDRRHHGSKWGQGAHQYGQLSSRDLVSWDEHPLAVPIVEQWECSMGTCDCIWHEGVYHMFYTDCGSRCEYRDKPQRGSWIFCATSTDGVHFQKDLKPLVPGGDCTVFRDPATGLFHLVRGGGSRLVSKDLRNWEEVPGDFVERKPGTTGECPHEFEWNGWYYFILGTNAIWKSRGALGPWEELAPTIYDGLFVPKVAEFTGNRRILAGFLFERGWAGHLALRELTQKPDGSLGTRFAPELIPASGPPRRLSFTALSAAAGGDGSRIQIDAPGRFAAGMLSAAPRNARITLRVVPRPGTAAFGLCLRGHGEYQGGCELRFEPARQRAQYGAPEGRGPAKDSTGRVALGRDYAIEDVDGLDRPFQLEIIVKDDIIDTCIDQRRTMITRRDPEPDGDRLFFFARDGEVRFEEISVRPLR